MGKTVKKVASVATLGLSDAVLGSEMETPKPIADVAAAPQAVSDDTLAAREAQRKRQLAAAGLGGNILTGAGGLTTAANTASKSLLGS